MVDEWRKMRPKVRPGPQTVQGRMNWASVSLGRHSTGGNGGPKGSLCDPFGVAFVWLLGHLASLWGPH